MDYSTPGVCVHHQLLEPTQTHVHWVGDTIQPSHPLSSPSPPSINLSSIRVFSSESVLFIRWPKYWSFCFNISPSNEKPGLISLGWTGWISLQSKGLSRSPTPQFKSNNSSVLSFLYSPILTSISHNHINKVQKEQVKLTLIIYFYLIQYIQNIIISMWQCDQCKVMRYFTIFLVWHLQNLVMYFIVTTQVLGGSGLDEVSNFKVFVLSHRPLFPLRLCPVSHPVNGQREVSLVV